MSAHIDVQPGAQVIVAPPGDGSQPYQALVREVSERGIELTPARRGNGVLDVTPGQALVVYVRHGGRSYRMTATVTATPGSSALGFTIGDLSAARLSERRAFYRQDTRIEPSYAARLDEEGPMPLTETVILDVSGGGVRLRTSTPVAAGARLQLVFALDDDPLEVDVETEVLRVVPPEPPRRTFHVHCAFVETSRRVTERIVRFVFRQQVAENQRRAS